MISREEQTEYVVVMRARSSARFLPEEGFELNLEPATATDPNAAQLRMFTRWVASGHAEPLPRELVIEVRGREASIDEAIRRFAGIARPMATLAAFVANVRVGPAEVHLAYDCTPDSEERQFVEAFLADETGAVTEGRIARVHLMTPTSQALLAAEPERQSRLDRALRQYERALREWFVGGESLALSHLYMAVDTLAPAVIGKLMIDRGLSKEELASSVGIDPADPKRPRWRQALEVWSRSEIIFGADSEIYQAAKAASDGVEHGYLELTEVYEHALKAADKTFAYVRKAIIDLIDVAPDVGEELLTIKPKDVQSRRKIVRGRLVGVGEDPAPDEEMYPRLEWSSSIGSVTRQESTFTIQPKDQFTVRTRPGIGFHMDSIEEVGRLEEGQVPRVLDPMDIEVTPGRSTVARGLLKRVVPIADAATKSGEDTPQEFPRIQVFNLFGQGMAFFQSGQTLLETYQPIEALLALRGLVMIAARFEQMSDPSTGGLGLAVRLTIDALDRQYGKAGPSIASEETLTVAAKNRAHLLATAESIGLLVPDEPMAIDRTRIWLSLTFEMWLGNEVSSASYVGAGMHLQEGSAPDRMGFKTKLEESELSDGIAAATVMAGLTLLKLAAPIFGWTLDSDRVDQLLAEATTLNETSFNPPTVTKS